MLSRFAWHEVELPLSEADGLRMMIFYLGLSRERNQSKISRSVVENG